MEIRFLSTHIFWYVILTLTGAGVGLYSYRVSFPPLGKLQRIALSVLRVLMIVLIGIFLVEPLMNIFSTRVTDPALAVLVDVSRSMGVQDGAGSRIENARTAVERTLSSIKSESDLFEFTSDIRAVDNLPEQGELSGNVTSIANALAGLASRRDIDKYGAVLLVTDGRQNLGEDPLEAAIRLNIPIHTLTLGEKVDEKNLSIDKILHPTVAYSGVEFKVEAELSGSALDPGKSRVFLKLGGSAVAEKTFDIPGENRRIRISFDVKAPEPGDYQYLISSPIIEGEANKADNERSFEVRVLKNKLRVLVGSSSLDWELKFVRQLLGRFEEFEVDAVYPQESSRYSEPGLPRGLDGLKKYDIVFLVDSSPADLRISPVDLKRYVEEGGSLIYLAGADSPNDIRLFNDLLPLKPVNPIMTRGEFFFEPSPTRRQHAAIALVEDPNISMQLWHSLPPFSNLLTGLEPNGDILLEAATSSRDSLVPARQNVSPISRPVLITGSFGRGHVAAITGFPIWRSYFGSVKDERISRAIPEFWRNLVKWSSATEQMQNFRVVTDKKIYRLGEPLRFVGYLFDEANKPKSGAFVSVTVFPDGDTAGLKDVVLPPADKGIYSEEIVSLPAGKYTFAAVATAFGDTLGNASGNFTIESFSLEMASSSPDYNLTRRISNATGGTAYTFRDIDQFPAQLQLTPYAMENQASFKPFGMPVLLIILLAGLCLEWGLRKRFRLP